MSECKGAARLKTAENQGFGAFKAILCDVRVRLDKLLHTPIVWRGGYRAKQMRSAKKVFAARDKVSIRNPRSSLELPLIMEDDQMSKNQSTPAPLETEPGKQMDDNVNDVGEKQGDKRLDQPVEGDGKKSGDKSSR